MTKHFLPLTTLLCCMVATCACSEDPLKMEFNPNKPGTGEDSSTDQTEVSIYHQTPQTNQDEFLIRDQFSCEFDQAPDANHWESPEDFNFAAWSFAPENAVTQDGVLKLMLTHNEHQSPNGSKQFYFKSGMLRSLSKVNYGYYEARIKGAPIWPGTCSAFWLYTREKLADFPNPAVNTITYNEIDVIELQQIARDKKMMACNMHLYAMDQDNQGNFFNTQYKAGKYPELGRNEFHITDYWPENGGWNPEDDFHIYACENRPDSVVFYIDGVRVGSKPNYYWHMDMHICLSLGLRTPFEEYLPDGTRQGTPTTAAEATAAGFPAGMEVDYVRSYTRKGGYDSFRKNKIPFDKNNLPIGK